MINHQTEKLTYLRTMGDTEVSLLSIPCRIINRYVDNIKYLGDKVLSLINSLSGKSDDLTSIEAETSDPFGIKKTLVLLTKPNKVIAISSFNGAI